MERSTERLLTTLALGLCIGFAAAIAVGAFATTPQGGPPTTTGETPPLTRQTNRPDSVAPVRQTAVTEAVAATAPSVVSITTVEAASDLFRSFYGHSGETSAGSGVVIDPRGVILTNAHVVASASNITVTFADNTQLEADVIGLAEDLDLAVLRVPEKADLEVAQIGNSDTLILGEPVIAIGNPFGLGHTVTTGVVSAVSRPLETDERVFQDFIQTDASINPGNSGGPLLDATGSVIGINTAIRPNAQGIGFAIPIGRAIKIATDLVESGTVRIPWLGVLLNDTAFRSDTGRTTVPEVAYAFPANPLESGDLIVGVDGRAVQGRSDLNAFLSASEPGARLKLDVIRNRKRINLTLNTSTLPIAFTTVHVLERVGISLSEHRLGRNEGATIGLLSRSGTAARIGLRDGDTIIGCDGESISGPNDFISMAHRAIQRHRTSVLLTVQRGNVVGRVPLPL